MPGYIIHLTEAEMILAALRKRGCFLGENFEEEFLLGALLPDTKRKREKVSSHFWSEESMLNLAIPPVLEAFEKKYKDKMSSPIMWGYWAHLHLDELFVKKFWPTIVTFLGEDGTEKKLASEITKAYLVHQKKEISVEKFFSSEYYYGDYDRTNQLFYEKFQLHLPKMQEGLHCPVEEVDLSDMNGVLTELKEMLSRDRAGDEMLQVFEEGSLITFLMESAVSAAEKIGGDLKNE